MGYFIPDLGRAFPIMCSSLMNYGVELRPNNWQSRDVSNRPEARMFELIHVGFQTLMRETDLDHYRKLIQPNLPWADDHFEQERVSGHPLNPGETWRQWPWAQSADGFRREGEQFSHTYAERFWPHHAGMFNSRGGRLEEETLETFPIHQGIRYNYGDLNDLLNLLRRDPETRQAYLPVWFPEDTGVCHSERVPCTLGYHFMRRNDQLHCFYSIRSCDIIRHFRDDIYLAVRLVLWILEQLEWSFVRPGIFTFWAGSLHCFVNDMVQVKENVGG